MKILDKFALSDKIIAYVKDATGRGGGGNLQSYAITFIYAMVLCKALGMLK